jgi:hypothetical protein
MVLVWGGKIEKVWLTATRFLVRNGKISGVSEKFGVAARRLMS